jgi:hypothetical protein
MVNIGFLANHLGLRGSEIALYDYAYYNQTILKNKSYILYDKMNDNNDEQVIEKFKKEFAPFKTICVSLHALTMDLLYKTAS